MLLIEVPGRPVEPTVFNYVCSILVILAPLSMLAVLVLGAQELVSSQLVLTWVIVAAVVTATIAIRYRSGLSETDDSKPVSFLERARISKRLASHDLISDEDSFHGITLLKLKQASKNVTVLGVDKVEAAPVPVYVSIADDDPGSALASARRDLERRLKEVARRSDIYAVDSLGIAQLVAALHSKKVTKSPQTDVIERINKQLNRAVHGVDCDTSCAQWLKEDWPKILVAIEKL